MGYLVKLEVFEGPFDLLLELISKEELNIFDISIARIVEQYLAYLHQMQQMDLVVSSEFLLMAATLIAIKARTLLPEEDTDIDEDEETETRESLIEKLLQYKTFKAIAKELQNWEAQGKAIYLRGNPQEFSTTKPLFKNLIGDVTVKDLAKSYAQMLEARDHLERERIRFQHIRKKKISVQKRLAEIRIQLVGKKEIDFEQLLIAKNRQEIVTTFLAVLELARLNEIVIHQQQAFGKIVLRTDYAHQKELTV